MKPLLKYVILFFGVVSSLKAQTSNNNCANATPFCTGQTMNFPATTNVPNSQPGPAYGCLGSQPNPAWFFFQVANGGTMSIAMSANNDIDFICWGPFPNLTGACGNLTAGNIQSCSYSSSATETCVINNAIPGAFYIMLITNFSNTQQNITFNQNNANQGGAASTNCGFVCVVSATNSGIICAGNSNTLSMAAQTSSAVTSYTWFGPNSFSSSSPQVVLPNLQSGGVYTLVGTANATLNNTPYTGTCQSTTTVQVVQYPNFSINPTFTSICQGGSFDAAVVFSSPTPTNQYFFNWSPASNAGVFSPQSSATHIQPLLLPVTTTLAQVYYGVTVTPTLMNCPFTHTMAVTINNPLTPSVSVSTPVCDNYSPIQLFASPGGGTWTANPAVTANGLFTPSLATSYSTMVYYSVSVGTCVVTNSDTLFVSKYHRVNLTTGLSRCVQDPLFSLMTIVQDTMGRWNSSQVQLSGYKNRWFNAAGLATGNYSITYTNYSLPDSVVCPTSTVLVVPVFNPPVPVIAPISPRCNTWGTVQLSATPGGGTFSGSSGVSVTGILNPTNVFQPYNSVTYTAGQGTCVASSSRSFEVSTFMPATISGTVIPQCASGSPVNLLAIVQNTTGLWSGVNTALQVFNPASLPTGVYTLTYSTLSSPSQQLCPDTKTINVSVLNPPTPKITPVGPLCTADAPFQLTVTPSTGSWVVTSYVQPNGVFVPGQSPAGSNPVQYIIGTSTCNAKQTVYVTTEAFVPAKIIQKIPDQCSGNLPINLVPFTTNTLGAWSGPGISGQNFNPANSGTGKITLVYKTASIPSGLCPDKDTLAVQVFSLDAPVIAQAGPFCNNAKPFQLQVSPLGGVFGGARPGAVNSAGLFYPSQAVIGNNLVNYSISAGPCVSYAQATISIDRFVTAQIDKQPSPFVCINQQPFDLNSYVHETGGTWSGPGLLGPSMFDPAKAIPDASNILYYHTSSAGNALLCPDVSSVQIVVKNLPKASILSGSITGCAPLSVGFSSPDNKTGKGLWIFDDGSDKSEGFTTAHTFTSPGSYNVLYKYEDIDAPGCSTIVKMSSPVKVLENPKADFSVYPEEVTTADPTVNLTNRSSVLPDNRYQWSVQGMGSVYSVHTDITFPQAGNYRVTLIATNAITGCKSEISRYIEVKNDFNYFIPNSFTPNFDGVNDIFIPVFSPFGLDPQTYRLDIFTRWGQNVFSTTDHTEGWDGSFRNYGEGVLMPDSYDYQVTFRDLEGRVYKRNGVVFLMK